MKAEKNFWELICQTAPPASASDYACYLEWQKTNETQLFELGKALFLQESRQLSWPQRPAHTGQLPEHCQQYSHIKQSGCPGQFARFTLLTSPAERDSLQVSFREWTDPRSGYLHPAVEPFERLWMLPALLKGLWEGLQVWPLPHGSWRLEKLIIHPIDSQPWHFYVCGRKAIQQFAQWALAD